MSSVSYVRHDPDAALAYRLYMRDRRKRLRAAGLCVNAIIHGPRVKGGRCATCWAKKTKGAAHVPGLFTFIANLFGVMPTNKPSKRRMR